MELSKNFKGDNVEYSLLNKINNKQFTKIDELIPGHAYGWDHESLTIMRDKSKQKNDVTQQVFFVLNKTNKWVFISYFKFEQDVNIIDYTQGKRDYFSNDPIFGRYYFGKTMLMDQNLLDEMINNYIKCNKEQQKMKDNFFAGKKRNIGYKSPLANKYPHYDILQYVSTQGLYEYDLNLSIIDNFNFDHNSLFADKYNCNLVYPSHNKRIFDDPEVLIFRDICFRKK